MAAAAFQCRCQRKDFVLCYAKHHDVRETGLSSVMVPVLSKAIAVSRPRFSRCAPPLISTPNWAARATAERTAAGVPMASAHGEAATSTAIAR